MVLIRRRIDHGIDLGIRNHRHGIFITREAHLFRYFHSECRRRVSAGDDFRALQFMINPVYMCTSDRSCPDQSDSEFTHFFRRLLCFCLIGAGAAHHAARPCIHSF